MATAMSSPFSTTIGAAATGILSSETSETFDRIHLEMCKNFFRPILVRCSNGDVLSLAGVRVPTYDTKKALSYLHSKLKCNECNSFLKSVSPYQDANGKGLLEDYDYYKRLNGSYRDQINEASFKVIDSDTLGVPVAGGFVHYHVRTEPSDIKSLFTVEDYDWFLNQNLRTMINLMEKNNSPGIIPSLELLIKHLPDITYGDNILASSKWFLKWMREYVMLRNPFEKKVCAARTLLDAFYVNGLSPERIVVPYLKQVKDNTINALECAHNLQALKSLLTTRFAPSNYCRPTADPTDGRIKEAMSIFKDKGFKTTYMKLDNITKYGGKIIGVGGRDAMDAFSSMLSKNKKSGAAGFASRSGVFVVPKTLDELFKNSDNIKNLYIDTSTLRPIVLTEYPETSAELFIYPHLWAFTRSDMSKIGVRSGWERVLAIHRMDRNIFFILGNTNVTTFESNTCFPSFLKPAYNRKCGSAFENLNTTTTPEIPSGKICAGVGTSLSSGKVVSPIKLRCDGKVFTLDS